MVQLLDYWQSYKAVLISAVDMLYALYLDMHYKLQSCHGSAKWLFK